MCEAFAADRLGNQRERPLGQLDRLDDLFGSQAAELLDVPGGGDRGYRRALLAGDLDLETTDCAACARNQDTPAGQVAAETQGPQRGRACHRERGGGSKADVVRQEGEAVGRNGDTFGPPSLVGQSRDPGANGWPGAVGCGAFDHPGYVLAGCPAVRAYGEEAQFAAVHRGCADRDQRLVHGGPGLAAFGERQPGRALGRND